MRFFVGLDWASKIHAVCVVNERGEVHRSFQIEHSKQGLQRLRDELAKLAQPGIRLAIERPDGLLVDTLVEAGVVVVPIHPNVVKASRPRYSAACGKADRGDAYLLADLLRTDGHRFQPLRPQSSELRALRTLVATRTDFVTQRVGLTHRLRALLEAVWPGAESLFSRLDSKIALTFLRRYPTAASARRMGEKRLARFLAKSGYCGRRTPGQLLEHLRSAPSCPISEHEAMIKQHAVLGYVAAIAALNAQVEALTKQIEELVMELPRGRVIASFPRAGKVNAAQILAELGDDPARFADEAHLAAVAGVAPVTFSSGKKRGVACRWMCNKRLRQAVTIWAGNSRHDSPWAADIYARAKARGCKHPHAVRILARAWIRVLWRCWRDGVLYDPEQHGGARRLATAIVATAQRQATPAA